MDLSDLRRAYPIRARVANARANGTVTGHAILPAGPVIYVEWDTSLTNDKGEVIPWRDTVAPESITVVRPGPAAPSPAPAGPDGHRS
jgi:hypothetical protein